MQLQMKSAAKSYKQNNFVMMTNIPLADISYDILSFSTNLIKKQANE